MQLWTALLLGFVGSAHCAGMCGPLALALPTGGGQRSDFVAGRLLYNGGRIVTYTLLGGVFALLGQTFALVGWQRWLSLVAGGTILISYFASSRLATTGLIVRNVTWLKSRLAHLLKQRTRSALFGFGILNGLLPCGLVYTACAAATTAENPLEGMGYMLTFGLGTLPLMLALSLMGKRLQFSLRFRLQRLVPYAVLFMGCWLLLRGMNLGIPYISPHFTDKVGEGLSCH